jgi:antitoxin component YwqK of YwqJK toxin-antitoxin module
MRRIIVPMMLIGALAVASVAQQKKSDLEQAGLKGKVKSVKFEETRFSTKTGKSVEGKRVHTETQNYGENGILVKSVRYDSGSPVDYFYSYDSKGKRLELSRSATSSTRINTEFKYDANGNKLEEVQMGDEGLVNRIVYVYDAQGRPAERRIFNKQGLFARRAYTYGADWNPTEEAEYDPKGALSAKQGYSYELDPTGNWIKRTTFAQGTSSGKAYSEPAAVTYRTITYY